MPSISFLLWQKLKWQDYPKEKETHNYIFAMGLIQTAGCL